MHYYRSRSTLPLLIVLLIAGCSPTREVVRPVSTDDILSKRYYIINELLYLRLGLRNDTLVAKAVRKPASDGSRGMVHVLGNEAAGIGLDMRDAINLALLESPRIIEKGDTLLIPIKSIDVLTMRERNPSFVAGVVAGTVVIVLVTLPFVLLLLEAASHR